MKVDRRDFIKGLSVAGVMAAAPTALKAQGMTSWLCVVVDSVDDLTSDLKSSSDTVIVKDLNRGGTFIYDSTKSTINDGGVVFNGWVRQNVSRLNALWFGAIGDGVTDDTQALQKAIFHTTGWDGRDYNLDDSISKTLYIPRGTYRITDSLKITQMQYIVGDGYGSGGSNCTEILCDFNNFNPPTDNYSNTYEGHPSITLAKKPMLYNIKMANYIRIEGIRFNANYRDVYGVHLNDIYYSKLDTISILNCNNSGLTLITAQFNELRNIAYINNAGPIRIINSMTLDFDNLDIENTQTGTKPDVEIVHSSIWKAGINIRNIHIEELSGKSKIVAGARWLISQKGVRIEGLQGTFSSDSTNEDLDDRYIYLADPQNYSFDGNLIQTAGARYCDIESVGSGHMWVKMDPNVELCKVIGLKVVQEDGSKDTHKIAPTEFLTGFKVLNQDRKKVLWFENDNSGTIHLFDNANRKFYQEGSNFTMENSYGRLKLKAGEILPDIDLIADDTSMITRDDKVLAKFHKDYIKLPNLPTSDPNLKDQLWNDNGILKISSGV